MARFFDESATEAIYSDSLPAGAGLPLTISGWFNCPGGSAQNNCIIQFIDKGEENVKIGLFADKSTGNNSVSASASNDLLLGTASTVNTWSVDTWHNGVAIFASSASRVAYLDGDTANKGTDTTAGLVLDAGFDRTGIGANLRATSPNGFMEGNIAEIGVWNVALTESEAVALAKGASPLLVRPGSLIFYLPMVSGSNTDLIGGMVLTDHTTTPAESNDHAPVFYPTAQILQFSALPSTATSGGTATNVTEATIVSVGGTVTITLTGDTFIAAGTGPIGSTAQSDTFVAAFTSAQSEGSGWNATVRDVLDNTDLVRTSDTVATLTVPATAGYDITATETITPVVQGAILTTSGDDVTASSFTISPTVSIPAGGGGNSARRRRRRMIRGNH